MLRGAHPCVLVGHVSYVRPGPYLWFIVCPVPPPGIPCTPHTRMPVAPDRMTDMPPSFLSSLPPRSAWPSPATLQEELAEGIQKMSSNLDPSTLQALQALISAQQQVLSLIALHGDYEGRGEGNEHAGVEGDRATRRMLG